MAEVIIYYHLYNRKSGTLSVSSQPASVVVNAMPVKRGTTSSVFLRLSKFSALIGIALILFFYTPRVLAWGESVVNATFENFRMSKTEVQTLKSDLNISKPIILPPFDPRLPLTNQLLIPSIGVNTGIQEATLDNYEQALRKGVWRVSDFGAPNDNSESIILAAHRFGYLAWTDSYRRKNSFYNLPKVEVGDLIEIDWNQRKYLYEVYATSKGAVILDYSADLILYTCETLAGDNKIFVYARLIVV
ncbi:MAG: sortase [Candidatus Woesebacteria bacterium]|nr:sortase [Candidatus Woesebacteria bacterium]